MLQNPCSQHVSQFEVCKQIYTSGILNKVALTPTAKLVLIALANHFNPEKPDMFPSQKYLASQLGISPSSIERAIKEMRNKGLIIYETKTVNRYRFTNIFFGLIELTGGVRQIDRSDSVKLTNKHISEKKKNSPDGNFKKVFNKADSMDYKHKKSFYPQEAPKGGQYKVFVPEKVDIGSPMDFTKEQAMEYLQKLPDFLNCSFFARELKKKWGL